MRVQKSLETYWMHHVYVKQDLALNNQQWLICHKTKLNQIFVSSQLTFTELCYIEENFENILI